jgi:putative DNA primase/helicase
MNKDENKKTGPAVDEAAGPIQEAQSGATETPDSRRSAEKKKGGNSAEAGGDPFHIAFQDDPTDDGVPPPAPIQVREGQIARVVDETQDKLLATDKPVFQRGGILVLPVWTKYQDSHERDVDVTVLQLATSDLLRYCLNKWKIIYLRLVQPKAPRGQPLPAPKFVDIDPPDKMLKTLLGAVGQWRLPNVVGIINAPTMRPDGSVIARNNALDPATKLYAHWHDSLVLPPLAERPSKDEALAARDLFLDLLAGFPFVNDTDKAVALAGLLTALLRGAFTFAPMFLVRAHVMGTGKSFLVDIVSNIVNGRDCPVITAGETKEEMEKRLGVILLEGTPIINLDNLTRDLTGELINQMLTQRIVRVRILGFSRAPACEWCGTLFATGNNVALVGDLVRRGLTCNMAAREERPELRKFEFNPIARVHADRGRFIAAAFTLARAFMFSGERVDCKPLAGFGPWSKVVREPLIWLGMPDVVDSMEEARKEDPERVLVQRLMLEWQRCFQDEAKTTAEIVNAAREEQPNSWVLVRPDLHAVLVERCGDRRGQIDTNLVGQWLKTIKGQVHSLHDEELSGQYRLIRAQESRTHGNKWRLEWLPP